MSTSREPKEGMESPCPCCRFVVDDNLFLPSSEKKKKKQDEDTSTPEEGSTAPLPPIDCWDSLVQNHHVQEKEEEDLPIVVDTHGHAHLQRDSENIYCCDTTTTTARVMSLTCAVEPNDWKACLAYTAHSSWRIPAIGVHPWYLANLPETTWLRDLEALLQQHTGCMVGEIGLCKIARFVRTYEQGKQAALELQRQVFVQQLRLAAQYQRPVTVHCVQQQGVLLDILKDNQDNLPPAIALHSFTGTAHQVKKLLEWEHSLNRWSDTTPLLYFGFSHAVNYAMCTSDKSRRQGREAVLQVPVNRLLAESDVHHDANVAVGTAGAIAYLAWARDVSIGTMADQTRRNGLQFFRRLQVHSS